MSNTFLTLSGKEARNIVWDEIEGWKEVKGTRVITDTSRWSIYYEGVFHNEYTNKFYKLHWSEGATEQQDEMPFEYDEKVKIYEVTKKKKIIDVWE